MLRRIRLSRSGRGLATSLSLSTWAATRKCSIEVSPLLKSGAISRICAISATSNSTASSKRLREWSFTPEWTKAVSAVSLLAMPSRSKSWRAVRTPSALRRATSVRSSVEMPLSGSASIRLSAMACNWRR